MEEKVEAMINDSQDIDIFDFELMIHRIDENWTSNVNDLSLFFSYWHWEEESLDKKFKDILSRMEEIENEYYKKNLDALEVNNEI